MRIVRDKVEQTLIETAQVCQKMNVPLRCLYIRIGDQHRDISGEGTKIILDFVESFFKNHEIDAMAYVAEDGDVFFLSRQITNKTRDEIIKLFPGQLGIEPSSSVQLYEMQIDTVQITRVCNEKIERRLEQNQAEENARLKAQEDARHMVERNIEQDIALNSALLETFSQRRAERRSISILIVEDDPFSQKLISNALRGEVVDIFVASSGRQALQVMMKSAPDMIFLDIGLPDVTGLEILDEIFQIDPKAHVVMLSGNGSRDNVVGAIQKGARDFIGKPFTVEKLHVAMTKCVFIQEKRIKKGVNHG